MRHFIVSWSIGLLSLSWLAGCGCLRENGCSECHCFSRCGLLRLQPAACGEKPSLLQAIRRGGRLQVTNGCDTLVIDTTPQEMPKTQKPPAPQKMLPPTGARPEVEPPPVVTAAEPVKARGDHLPLPKVPQPLTPAPRPESIDFSAQPPTPTSKPLKSELSPGSDPALPPVINANATKVKEQTSKNVQIKYGTVDEFQSITGQVQQWKNTWRLRYAAVDQEDAFGGCFILEGGRELSQLRDGQRVRVHGLLVPSANRQTTPRYRVQSLEVLD